VAALLGRIEKPAPEVVKIVGPIICIARSRRDRCGGLHSVQILCKVRRAKEIVSERPSKKAVERCEQGKTGYFIHLNKVRVNRTPSPGWTHPWSPPTWPKTRCRQPTDNGSMGPTVFVHVPHSEQFNPYMDQIIVQKPYKVLKKKNFGFFASPPSPASSVERLSARTITITARAWPRLASPRCPLVHGFRRRLPSLSSPTQPCLPSHKFLWRTPRLRC
jgi:hypothetical protein